MSSNAFINAIQAMELSQMCVQAMWDRDSPLKQIPGFTNEVVKRCNAASVESVYDILDLDDAPRIELLQMDAQQLAGVVKFCNAYPSIAVSHEVEDESSLSAGSPIILGVSLEREEDDDEASDQIVVAPFFPIKKIENWWIVVAEASTKQCVST